MTPEYAAALRQGRERMGAMDRETARAIAREIRIWGEQMAAWLRAHPNDPRAVNLRASREIIFRTATEMDGRIRRATLANRNLLFDDVLTLWRNAGLQVAARREIPGALLGAVRSPPLTLLTAIANRPGAATWQTLLRGHVANAATEADAVVRQAILARVSPQELARRLRRYVVGSEPFQSAFTKVPTETGEAWKLDLRTVPPESRGQARQMKANAERIAITEVHAARADAETLHFIADPLIAGVLWTLAPDRGTQTEPDICDVLATADMFGMGAGVFPLHRVPGLPHPHDRCERMPVERSVSEAGNAKPTPDRLIDLADVTIPRAGMLTPLGAERIRRQLREIDAMTAASGETIRARLGPTAEGIALAASVR